MGKKSSINMYTDSKKLFDLVMSTSYKAENKVMIDVAGIREGFKVGNLGNIGLIVSEHTPYDGIAKDSGMKITK